MPPEGTKPWESALVVTENEVRQLALALPGAREQPSYGGRPSWRTPSRMFAWLCDDPVALVVWVETVESKRALLTASPSTFFTTAHYDSAPVVLVDMDAVDVREVAELLVDSWLLRAPRSLTRPVDDPQTLITTLMHSLRI